jgi:hypothetical protein
MDYRFNFALPVRTNQLTFQFATRLHLLPRAAFNPIEDLRVILSLQHHLAGRHDYLRSLSETTNKQPHAFALVYESNVLNNSEMTQNEVRRLGARTSVLIHFFALP